MKLIDRQLLDLIGSSAKGSERLRKNFNLHESLSKFTECFRVRDYCPNSSTYSYSRNVHSFTRKIQNVFL